nr:histone chaperone RTT106-like [Nicotiana tomentosiformis]
MGGGSSAGDLFWDCFAGADDASDIGDASFFLEEAQRFISRAISKFRADLSQCEVELQKVSGERDTLRLFCGQKDETKRVGELEARLAEVKAEVELLKVMADKSIVVYRDNAEAAQKEAREASDAADTRAYRAKELEADAEALVSVGDDDGDDDDDDDDGDDRKGGSDDEGDPGGEETALDDNPEA